MKKIWSWFGQWYVLIIVSVAVFFILIPYVGDNDFWFHLRIGEVLWEQKALPRADIFSYTALGMPWINHEWLVQLVFYGTYSLASFLGIGILVALVGGVMAVALLWEFRRSFWLSSALVIVSFAVLRPFFVPRPQIFAYALLLALVLALRWYYRTRGRRIIWVLPLIMFLWGNIHASVAIGAGVLGMVVAVEFVRRRFPARYPSQLSSGELGVLFQASVLAIGASLLNPFFYQVYIYALQPLWYAKAYHSLIETRPIFQNLGHDPVLLVFVFHVTLGALFAWRLVRRAVAYEKVLFAIFFLAPFASIKYIPFSWMAMLPIVLSRLPDPVPIKKYTPSVVVGLLCLVVLMCQPWASIAADPHREWPKSLMAFMDDRAVQGKIYNSYTWGGYMMWESKERPVFIYGGFAGFYERNYFDSLDFVEGKRVDELIQRYDFSAALVRPWEPLAYVLSLKDDWQLVYWDNFGMIFVRDDGQNQALFREQGMRIRYINDSVDAMIRKYPAAELPALEKNLRQVLEENPDTLLARYRLGVLYKAAGRCDMALEHFKAVIAIDGRLGGAHGRLAECYAVLNMFELAEQEQELSEKYANHQRWWYGRP